MFKIGVDEAGRGSWLGPVVACSLAFNLDNMPSKYFLSQLDDSKKLSKKKRQQLFEELVKFSILEVPKVYFGIGVVDNYLIDEINIKNATKLAIKRSFIDIFRRIDKKKVSQIFIDGNDNFVFEELEKQPIYVICGDQKVLEIKAASIIAKVFRDKLIDVYALIYPNLGIENHKGYGTKKHAYYLSDISKVTGIHRISYSPVKKILNFSKN